MKKLLLMVAVAAAAFGLGAIFSQAGPGVPAEQKIATVNLAKVFDKYYKTIRSTTAIKQEAADMEKERKDMIDSGKKQESEWQKLIEKSEDQGDRKSTRLNSS